jgi:2-desacetyl-2-hydroxyethyl bacteriochlorophyllide A dehydrogenase
VEGEDLLKAALLVRPEVIVVDEIAEPTPGPDDVLIGVGGVGLCGSDVSVFRGTWIAPSYPWLLGHEIFGVVEAVGKRVPSRRVGELVVVEPNIPCFRCVECERGRSSSCLQRESIGMNRPGGLADKVVVPSPFAWMVDPGSATDLVCIEPLTVVETALSRLPGPLPTSALVVGAGAQGLLMCLALLRRGVDVHTLDVNLDRIAFATSLGAKSASADEGDRRFALVIDSAGTPESMRTALDRIESWGTLLVLGIDKRPFEISSAFLVRRQLTLRGSLTYDHPTDFGRVIDLVQDGHLSPGRVTTDEYPLADVQRAFESSASSRGKSWVRVNTALP